MELWSQGLWVGYSKIFTDSTSLLSYQRLDPSSRIISNSLSRLPCISSRSPAVSRVSLSSHSPTAHAQWPQYRNPTANPQSPTKLSFGSWWSYSTESSKLPRFPQLPPPKTPKTSGYQYKTSCRYSPKSSETALWFVMGICWQNLYSNRKSHRRYSK